MDLDQILTFITVAQTQSFSKTAQQLHLTQPAISKRIQLLEQYFEVQLIDRSARQAQLTEAGHLILPELKKYHEQIRHLKSKLQGQLQSPVGPLRLAMSHYLAAFKLPALLRGFLQAYPYVDLQLEFVESEQGINLLQSQQKDLAIITLSEKKPAKYQKELLWKEELCLVIAKSIQSTSRKNLNQLQQTLIIPESNTQTYRLIQQALAKSEINFKKIIHANSFITIKSMVEHGIGWAFLPKHLIDEQKIAAPDTKISCSRSLGVIYSDSTLPTTARFFLNYLLNHC